MIIKRPALPFVFASIICAGAVALPLAQQASDAVTVPFSDAARPGLVKVTMHTGGIVVKGGTRRDVAVLSRSRNDDSGRRRSNDVPAGLRKLTQSAGFSITEENNEMTIAATAMNRAVDVDVQVPNRVNLKLATMNDG